MGKIQEAQDTDNSSGEKLYLDAKALVFAHQNASTSFIQRHLRIGYNSAARMIERMEKEGIVTAPNETGKRSLTDKAQNTGEIVEGILKVSAETGVAPKDVLKVATNMIGHNSGDDKSKEVGGISGKRLRGYLDRIERLEEEKKGIADDIRDIYAEAKGVGFDAKIIRKVYALRKMNTDKRREEAELIELYKAAVGLD